MISGDKLLTMERLRLWNSGCFTSYLTATFFYTGSPDGFRQVISPALKQERCKHSNRVAATGDKYE